MSGLKDIKRSSIDLILTDPPYNLASYSRGNIKAPWRKEINNDLAEWDLKEFNPAEWRKEFTRVLKPTGTIFAFTSYNLLGKWHEAFDPIFDTFQFVVWHKKNPIPKFRRAGFLNSCELIVALWNKGHTWNFTNQRDMHNLIEGPEDEPMEGPENFIESPICMGSERWKSPPHPTQKPIFVLKRLIELATNQDDLVLDPFMGVGSTGVASLQLGRRFHGFEIDSSYFNAAESRLHAISLTQQEPDIAKYQSQATFV